MTRTQERLEAFQRTVLYEVAADAMQLLKAFSDLDAVHVHLTDDEYQRAYQELCAQRDAMLSVGSSR